MMYDPLGNGEWRARQDAKSFQSGIREYEDLTGREHPLRDDRVSNTKPVSEHEGPKIHSDEYWLAKEKGIK